MFQSGVAFGERVYLAHPRGTTVTVDVPVLLPGGGPSTRARATTATPATRADSAGPGRRNRRSTDTSRSKTTRTIRGRTSSSGGDPTSGARLVLPGRPDPSLAAARAVPVDVDRALTRCVTTSQARWASEVLQISDWRRAVSPPCPPAPPCTAGPTA